MLLKSIAAVMASGLSVLLDAPRGCCRSTGLLIGLLDALAAGARVLGGAMLYPCSSCRGVGPCLVINASMSNDSRCASSCEEGNRVMEPRRRKRSTIGKHSTTLHCVHNHANHCSATTINNIQMYLVGMRKHRRHLISHRGQEWLHVQQRQIGHRSLLWGCIEHRRQQVLKGPLCANA